MLHWFRYCSCHWWTSIAIIFCPIDRHHCHHHTHKLQIYIFSLNVNKISLNIPIYYINSCYANRTWWTSTTRLWKWSETNRWNPIKDRQMQKWTIHWSRIFAWIEYAWWQRTWISLYIMWKTWRSTYYNGSYNQLQTSFEIFGKFEYQFFFYCSLWMLCFLIVIFFEEKICKSWTY